MSTPTQAPRHAAPHAFDGTWPLLAQLHGVENVAWRRFIHALTVDDEIGPTHGKPRPHHAETSAGGLGCFDLRPPRLADLGLVRDLRVDNSSGRRLVRCTFVLPLTRERFLGAPLVQYNALLESLRRYDAALHAMLSAGTKLPDGMTRSGALALFHRLGPKALDKWSKYKNRATIALYQRTNKLF